MRLCSLSRVVRFIVVVICCIATIKLYRKRHPIIETSERDLALQWHRQAPPTFREDENVLRCSAEYLGCFVPSANKNLNKNGGAFSLFKCMEDCFSKRMGNYVGFRNGTCLCSNTVDTHFATHGCDVACSAEASQNCAEEGSFKLYKKTEGCFTEFSSDFLLSQRIGCVLIPQSLDVNMKAWKMNGLTSRQCILKCESTGNTVALPFLSEDSCICSDLFSMFGTAENMRVAMKSCNLNQTDGGEVYPVYKTFLEGCSPNRFLKRNEGPPAVLTSLWGSGNTWLRHLIEVTTGIYTGSIYTDGYLYRGGMLGEMLPFLSGRTIIIKDHMVYAPQDVSDAYTSGVLLIRNLYDATISEYARSRSYDNHTALLNPRAYKSADFKKFVSRVPNIWKDHVKLVLRRIPNVSVVFYEDLQQNHVKELRKIVEYLPQNLLPHGEELEKRLMCLNMDTVGNFKRGSKGIKEDPFDEETRVNYDKAIKEVNDILISRNKPGLPSSHFKRWRLR